MCNAAPTPTHICSIDNIDIHIIYRNIEETHILKSIATIVSFEIIYRSVILGIHNRKGNIQQPIHCM